ncbi:hypothetical protein [Marinimicrobium locisalis]|uniref:hypothetical protein n=1 Tax=Marinimicrobium locisalis TaxID=546022 RepID=UPI003221C691
MNQAVNIPTPRANKPRVQPARVINRDLSQANHLMAEFRKEVLQPGFKPAFQIKGSNNGFNIVSDIEIRIRKPWLISQSGASLCGPAAFMYCLAKDAPALYVQYVRDLFVTGKAKINDLEVEPSTACKNGQLVSGNGDNERRIEAVDWIALASLRDSENRIFRHGSVANDASGITLPGRLTSWFKAAGYSQVQEKARVLSSHEPEHLLAAAQDYQHNKNVCLFIAAKVVTGPFTLKAIPNHWVVLSEVQPMSIPHHPDPAQMQKSLEEQVPSLKAYSWGKEKEDINASMLSLADFSKYYFGYVVAG